MMGDTFLKKINCVAPNFPCQGGAVEIFAREYYKQKQTRKPKPYQRAEYPGQKVQDGAKAA